MMQIFLDGGNFDEIKKINAKGYTFNPSLYRKLGAKNYINFSKQILKKIKNKHVSLEVIADDEKNCIRQAKILSSLGKNVYVKIPIVYTNGKSTKLLIKKLIKEKIKLNITAIFTLKQIKEILPIVKNTKYILSIFSGRIYDIGKNAEIEFKKMNYYVKKNSKCKTLWASCRMPYDFYIAKRSGSNIITMSGAMIKKLKKFGTKPEKYSRETVIGFFNDAKKSNFKF